MYSSLDRVRARSGLCRLPSRTTFTVVIAVYYGPRDPNILELAFTPHVAIIVHLHPFTFLHLIYSWVTLEHGIHSRACPGSHNAGVDSDRSTGYPERITATIEGGVISSASGTSTADRPGPYPVNDYGYNALSRTNQADWPPS
jgi:hypothetical protein